MNLQAALALSTAVLLGIPALSLAGPARMEVAIVDRQDHATSYTYVVPGFSTTTGSAVGNCIGNGTTANCTASGTATTTTVPSSVGSYQVRGATLSLQLPDGRIAVVNCVSKTNWTDWSTMSMYRSCRVPLAAKVEAVFDGDKATLRWPVSIDGRKCQSETYRILAVLDKE